ncbi:MAG: shikimate dehydrogenase [Clostridia bacterium]|nr:shikimate dehydrogenase [Clostridia bacterium]
MSRMKCGLLGKTLGHSWSPEIHAGLADYEYLLYERAEEEIEDFLLRGDWQGMNVTIPYKKTVVPYLSELSPVAAALGSVNTIVRRADGSLYGDNTDVYGFEEMTRYFGFDVRGKKTLVLGSGGASVSIREALRRLGADPIVTISRSGEYNYDNLALQAAAALVVNTTPVGMYPHMDAAPLDLRELPACQGVLDIIYNPPETRLMHQAREMGIPTCNGLYMLVAQAWRAAEQFLGQEIPASQVEKIYQEMSKR